MKSRAWSKHLTSSGVTTYSPSVPAGSMTPSDRRRTKSPFWTCSGISISSRSSVMGNTFLALIGPVLQLQAWDLAVVFQVPRDQRSLVRQGNGGDQQVAPAETTQPLG